MLFLEDNSLYVSMLVRNLLLIALLTNSSREISPSPSPWIELRMSCHLILFDQSQFSWTPGKGAMSLYSKLVHGFIFIVKIQTDHQHLTHAHIGL